MMQEDSPHRVADHIAARSSRVVAELLYHVGMTIGEADALLEYVFRDGDLSDPQDAPDPNDFCGKVLSAHVRVIVDRDRFAAYHKALVAQIPHQSVTMPVKIGDWVRICSTGGRPWYVKGTELLYSDDDVSLVLIRRDGALIRLPERLLARVEPFFKFEDFFFPPDEGADPGPLRYSPRSPSCSPPRPRTTHTSFEVK